MAPIAGGLGGRLQRRCRSVADHAGSVVRAGSPILSAGQTPRTPREKWTFSILRVLAGVFDWITVGGGLGAVSLLDDFVLAHWLVDPSADHALLAERESAWPTRPPRAS